MEIFMSLGIIALALLTYTLFRRWASTRHHLRIEHDGLDWQIDPRNLRAFVRPLPGHPAAGGVRDYELRPAGNGAWQMRLSDASRWMLLDDARRELLGATDKQRLEVREEVETALHDASWRAVPEPVARKLEQSIAQRPTGAGTKLAPGT